MQFVLSAFHKTKTYLWKAFLFHADVLELRSAFVDKTVSSKYLGVSKWKTVFTQIVRVAKSNLKLITAVWKSMWRWKFKSAKKLQFK